ncbi:MAG TPA: S8 family peptidase [Candidatus Binatia bacterium]
MATRKSKRRASKASPRKRSQSEAPGNQMPQTDPTKKPFTPEVLDRTVIAVPLLDKIKKDGEAALQPIIIDLNLDYPGGRQEARKRALQLVQEISVELGLDPKQQNVNDTKSKLSQQYLFAVLEGRAIREVVRRDNQNTPKASSDSASSLRARRAIFRIWPDFRVRGLITKSISTVKADAARNSFSAFGENILWAVMDSGIDANHPHFKKHKNLDLAPPLKHRDFTVLREEDEAPLVDVFGHGTHVAGILAGEMTKRDGRILATAKHRDENGEVTSDTFDLESISGMAPKCKLLSLKVLSDNGEGQASNLIAAIEQIQEVNGNGRRIRIHGVNMSVGYDFEPEWFACGQSPLCVEVDRLVKSGVVVVVAAGNTGYGWAQSAFRGTISAGMDLTINDPGNAELAITVGSTHRESPHIYGVSYFSSKGPTGDGRPKPDLVAPGEKIISCASSGRTNESESKTAVEARSVETQTNSTASAGEVPKVCGQYKEDSGTSMAAPHVSGVIAAFLSVRREFIGQPEAVKKIFLSTATDLNRAPYFQGRGLVDLMRAIQSV